MILLSYYMGLQMRKNKDFQGNKTGRRVDKPGPIG
jgi:hypothetical protein